jgi:predicted DNA-binding transcriptional regulator AlpA
MAELVANGGIAMHNAYGKAERPEPASAASDDRRAALVEKRMLTDIEVAARLGVSPFTVRSWRLKGVGPKFLKMGRAVRYRPEDVDEYVRQALIEPQTR